MCINDSENLIGIKTLTDHVFNAHLMSGFIRTLKLLVIHRAFNDHEIGVLREHPAFKTNRVEFKGRAADTAL